MYEVTYIPVFVSCYIVYVNSLHTYISVRDNAALHVAECAYATLLLIVCADAAYLLL